jgi:hypothetical protein
MGHANVIDDVSWRANIKDYSGIVYKRQNVIGISEQMHFENNSDGMVQFVSAPRCWQMVGILRAKVLWYWSMKTTF